MNKKLFIYTALLAGLTACSVDEIDTPSGLGPDGELTVTLAVPQMQTVGTRADEDAVSNVTMLAVHDGTVKQQATFSSADLTSTDNGYTVKTKIDPTLRSESNVNLYFLANLPEAVTFAENLSEDDLKRMTQTTVLNGEQMTMSGLTTLSEVAKGTAVAVKRNGAKVTVTDGVQENGVWKPGSKEYPYQVYGTAASSRIVAATISDTRLLPDAVSATSPSFTGQTVPYVHPTRNDGRDVETRPYLIIKANYNTHDYYYRVEFENYDAATKKFTTLNLEPNHHYQVIITEIKAAGDLSAAAAAKNPNSLIEATINDYCPQSYNMITDGARELGVTHEIVYSGDPANNAAYVYIKLFSLDERDLTLRKEEVKTNNGWLSFGDPEEVTTAEEIGTFQNGGHDFDGKLYRVPVNFLETEDPGELKGKITVTWKGLTREVPVIWKRVFNGSDLCSASLSIRDASTSRAQIENYWAFLKTCNGVKLAQNNDKNVRDEGLHFPINYGGKASRWSYTYTLKFKNLNDGNPYDWKITHTGVSGINVNKTSGNNVTGETEVIVTRTPQGDDWQYEVGTLTFSISAPEQNNWIDYEIDLYHTGFFDNPIKFRNHDTERRVDRAETDTYYYYEVIAGPSGNYYWLDRNLGAISASEYIETSGGDTYYGDSDAAGGYYHAAKYNDAMGDPIMYNDLCPDGYEIPRVDVWNTLRNSPAFTLRQSGTRFLTQFTNNAGQTVYFPRCLFYDQSGAKTGESRAGYYWTATPAQGLEKDQIGNWLRYIKFSGNIASYDNAEVQGRGKTTTYAGSPGFAMSVRCVNETEAPTALYRTHFNVAGATHVFLYSLDNQGNKNAVTNWPGQAIGNYITMANPNQLFNFVYESRTTKSSEYYVIFTFRDEDGIWHTMSRGENNQAVYSNDKRPSELYGWKVENGVVGANVMSALGGTWKCTYNAAAKTASVTFIP